MAPRRPNMAPRLPPDRPSWPKMAPKVPPERPETSARRRWRAIWELAGPQIGSTPLQNRPKILQVNRMVPPTVAPTVRGTLLGPSAFGPTGNTAWPFRASPRQARVCSRQSIPSTVSHNVLPKGAGGGGESPQASSIRRPLWPKPQEVRRAKLCISYFPHMPKFLP